MQKLSSKPLNRLLNGELLLRVENSYSGVFLAKLNNLDIWGADIPNAYLELFTHEKLYFVAGPEFEELEDSS